MGEGTTAGASRDGADGVYAGPTVLPVLDGGVLTEREATGRVAVDADGAPVPAEYTSGGWQARVESTGTGGGAGVEDPQITSAGDGFGWAAVHPPLCGTVSAVDREWEVRAGGWEVDCDYAMEVSEPVHGGEGFPEDAAPERVRFLAGYSGSGGVTRLVDDTMACAVFRRDPDGTIESRTWFLSPCQPSAVVGEAEPGDVAFEEVEFEPRTLIDHHAVT